jgi:ribosomal subunit interface protein
MIKNIVKGHNLELTEAIQAAAEKVATALDKHVDPDDSSAIVEIEVSRTTNHHRAGFIFRAEADFHSRLGSMRAEAEREDLYVALAAVKDEIVESLRSKKSKRIDFVRRSGLAVKNMLRGLPWGKGKKQ